MEHDCAWDYIYIYIEREREREAALGYNVFHLFIF
jgi:trehalose/maltose hydrolase-like predicted phosphorylase